jgi:hypothetical protein
VTEKEEHIAQAEALVQRAEAHLNSDRDWAAAVTQLAQAHATLALAASETQPDDTQPTAVVHADFHKFQLTGPVGVRCWVCGRTQTFYDGDNLGLNNVTDWAVSHACASLAVT